jgi:hypothetical protein
MLENLDEDLLGQVHGIIAVSYESVANPVNLPLVPDHQFIESGHIAGKVSFNNAGINVWISQGHWRSRCQSTFHVP